MKKIETIWREILFSALEKGNFRFEQIKLAKKFGFSTSTVFQSLKIPRQMGAVRVTGRFFVLEDPEKLLYYWASVRNLEKSIIDSFRVEGSVLAIEGILPPNVVYGAYSAARMILGTSPADYDQIYLYSSSPEEVRKRVTVVNGPANFFILKPDEFLPNYGSKTTMAQTFVDLWNLKTWYAKEFQKAIKEKIDGILS